MKKPKKNKGVKKSTTDCPACKIDTADCVCGLSALVINNQNSIVARNTAILSFAHDESYFHAVVKYDHMVIEQHLGKTLAGSIGPYFGDIGNTIFSQIVRNYEEKACSIIGRRWIQAGGSNE